MGKATVIKCDAIWHTRLDSSAIKDNKGRKFLKRIDEDPSTHLGKIIIKDVDELRKIVNGTRKLNEINNFNKHTKAYLYDI
ncbi:MAG: hypothetical protein LBU89_14635, partial [Fibromonadaceae bacterium]|nr:hypothetical protein [Fibromonadaceae bacterium]